MFKCFSHQEIKTCKMEFSTNHISVYSLCPVAKFEDGKFPKPFSSLASDLVWPCLQFSFGHRSDHIWLWNWSKWLIFKIWPWLLKPCFDVHDFLLLFRPEDAFYCRELATAVAEVLFALNNRFSSLEPNISTWYILKLPFGSSQIGVNSIWCKFKRQYFLEIYLK